MPDPTASRWLECSTTGVRVRIAPRRQQRPSDYAGDATAGCPFCAGAEGATPPARDQIDGGAGWVGRVVPNLYPALEAPDGEHEVVIESPRHATRFVDLTAEESTVACRLWARRLRHWRDASGYGYQLVFKNEGPAAGASLEHVHSQVVALRDRPALAPKGVPPIDDRLIVRRGDGLTVAAAPAPRFAYTTLVLSADGGPTIDDMTEADAASRLAATLQQALGAVRSVSGIAAYNLMLHTVGGGGRWWAEIAPRRAVMAGFELATGQWINATPPEFAAEALRQALG